VTPDPAAPEPSSRPSRDAPPDPPLPPALAEGLRRAFLGEVGLDEKAGGGRALGP
jgi:hypothetical protein